MAPTGESIHTVSRRPTEGDFVNRARTATRMTHYRDTLFSTKFPFAPDARSLALLHLSLLRTDLLAFLASDPSTKDGGKRRATYHTTATCRPHSPHSFQLAVVFTSYTHGTHMQRQLYVAGCL